VGGVEVCPKRLATAGIGRSNIGETEKEGLGLGGENPLILSFGGKLPTPRYEKKTRGEGEDSSMESMLEISSFILRKRKEPLE